MSTKEQTKFFEHRTVPISTHGDPHYHRTSHLCAILVKILATVVKMGSAVSRGLL